MGFPGNGAPPVPAMNPQGFQSPQVNPASLASLYKNFQTGQTQSAVPADVVRNTQPPAGMPAQAPPADATTVPALPPPQTIGGAPAPQGGALADVWAALQKLKGQGSSQTPSWAQNFGNLTDQRG